MGWNPSPDSNVVGYFLCWGFASGDCTNRLDVGNVTSTTVGGLKTNITYLFTVVAYDGIGRESPPSNEVSYRATASNCPTITVSVNSATICAGDSATLTATNNASSPSYLWSPGGATTASITVSPASTTNYTVTVTDGTTGCTNSGSGTVTVNSLPTVTLDSEVSASCNGGEGSFVATFSGGAGGSYTLQLDAGTPLTGQTSPHMFSAAAGTHTVTVTDSNGCSVTSSSITVGQPSVVTVNSVTICAGDWPTLTATTSASDPSYLWSNGETNASITVSPDSTTNYTVTVTDGTTLSVNCGSGTLTVIPLPSLTLTETDATTRLGSNGTMTVTVSGGTPPYVVTLGTTTRTLSTEGSATTFNNLAAGSKGVSVTDKNGTGCAAVGYIAVGAPGYIVSIVSGLGGDSPDTNTITYAATEGEMYYLQHTSLPNPNAWLTFPDSTNTDNSLRRVYVDTNAFSPRFYRTVTTSAP